MTDQLTPLKRALLAIETLQDRLAELELQGSESIAVVGIGCRMPGGVDSPDALARLLQAERDAIVPRPQVARPGWPADGTEDLPPAGYLEIDPGGFEPGLFGISPREAASIDPQQRIALECTWEALENAAISPLGLKESRTGVFIGITGSDYQQIQVRAGNTTRERMNTHYASGAALSMASGRISYLLGLQGPSLSIDTACSSALVAIHLAAQSLRSRECDLAVAGGTSLILAADLTIAFQESGMLSPDGRCKTFDATANGFGRGEGCGVVVLKRASDAVRDGDSIWALIRGSAVNQDGPSSGLTAPNGPAQEAVIRSALRQARLTPADVGYVEAHGTGTELGDPIEVQALGAAYGERGDGPPLVIGTVKSNLGHLEGASGMAGLIKAILAVRSGEIPRSLHFATPNPLIPWNELALRVADGHAALPAAHDGKRRAGVSAFGFSGTNAHVILEQAPEPASVEVSAGPRTVQVLPVSARTQGALRKLCASYADALANGSVKLDDLCHTAGAGRAHLAERAAVACNSNESALEALRALARGDRNLPRHARVARAPLDAPRPVFLFTGQGAQYLGMGRTLYREEPVFRSVLDRCDAVLRESLGIELLRTMHGETGDAEAALQRTGLAQPALFAIEVALAELWRSWGVRPGMVIGHSVGEYAAAVVAGALSLEDGARLIGARARLMDALPPGGAMASIKADEQTVRRHLADSSGQVGIAAVNGPEAVVISGAEEAVARVVAALSEEHVESVPLRVSHAFHSALIEPALAGLERACAATKFGQPRVPLISNLSGRPLRADELSDPSYWTRHAREPVRFYDALLHAHGRGHRVFLECGPAPTLCGIGAQAVSDLDTHWIGSLRRDQDESEQIGLAAVSLYTAGVELDWAARSHGRGSRRTAIPTYPFERESLWVSLPDGAMTESSPARRKEQHPLLGYRVITPDKGWRWESSLARSSAGFLADHVVDGHVIVPAAAFLELGLAAARAGPGWGGAELLDVTIQRPLQLGDKPRAVHVRLDEPGDHGSRLSIQSLGEGEETFTLHVDAVVCPYAAGTNAPVDIAETTRRCPETLDAGSFYEYLRAEGLDFGPAFQGVRGARYGDGKAVGEISLPDAQARQASSFCIHPALLDAGLQVAAAAIRGRTEARGMSRGLFLPVTAGCIRYFGRDSLPATCRVVLEEGPQNETITASLEMYDASGRAVVSIERLIMKRLEAGQAFGPESGNDPVYAIEWVRQPGAAQAAVTGSIAVESIVRSLDAAASSLVSTHGLEHYDRLYADLEHLSATGIAAALAELGWEPRQGEESDAETLLGMLGILPRHRRLLRRFLAILVEDGSLEKSGDRYTVAKLATDRFQPFVEEMLGRFGDAVPELELTRRCGQSLARMLTGKDDPLEVLFPAADPGIMTRLYRETPIAHAMNSLVRQAVESVMQALPEGRKLRVLEVGAGTGGTTAHVLPILPAEKVEYTFTDIGGAFVAKGEAEFAARGSIRFETLDLDKDPSSQGFMDGQFDVVLASNVIHACKDVRQSLQRVARLLAPGGLMLALEAVQPQRWHDITVGLLDGWWAFSDSELRPEYALLDRARWLDVLRAEGFAAAATAPTLPAASVLGKQSVLVAQKPAAAITLPEGARNWLVFADGAGTAEHIVSCLREAGAETVEVEAGTAAAPSTGNPLSGIRHLLEKAVGADGSGPTDIAFCGALDLQFDDPSPAALDEQLAESCGGALRLIQALAEGGEHPPRLHIFTRGAVTVSGECVNPAHATLWGLARAVREERPEIVVRTVDLPLRADAGVFRGWLAAHAAGSEEPELAMRGAEIFVPRLRRHAAVARDRSAGPQRLTFGAHGTLEELHFEPHARKAPGEGEIEVRIEAAGLNFRDVMHALGVQYVGTSLGGECVGEVCAVGPGVEHVRKGDRVLAAIGSFGDYVTMHAGFAVVVPENLSIAAAATIPIAFLTADYALSEIGQMRAGETVLIHAAAGGVGMAAVQLARMAGLRVLATAGSEYKRERVKALGADAVFDSRSLDFEEQVRAATKGRGVDLVLNSLAGDFIAASLRTVAAGGRLLELGKTGIWTQEQVDACSGLKPGIRYHAVDLSPLLEREPDAIQARLRRLVGQIERGELKPLPHRVVAMGRASEAFRDMAAGRHLGKLVLVQDDELPVRADGTYLVTGGFSGIGLLVAERLAERGAGRLLLVGRSAPDQAAVQAMDRIRSGGTTVDVTQADIGRADELARVLELAAARRPLRGVVHCAGMLDDAMLPDQNWDRFRNVFNAKVMGSAGLARATESAPLDFLVFFSSVSAVFGSAGQANHSAANAFMDALASGLAASGRPALSIAWGAWSGTGAAVRRGSMARVSRRGVLEIEPGRGLEVFERLAAATTGTIVVSPMDWELFIAASGRRNMLVDHLGSGRSAEAHRRRLPQQNAELTIGEAVAAASPRRRARVLRQGVERCVSRVLGLAVDQAPEGRQPLGEVGLDSLLAVELRNALAAEVGAALPASLLFDFPTIDALVEHLGERLSAGDRGDVQPETGGVQRGKEQESASASVLDLIEGMSDVEVARKVKGDTGTEAP